ncbi:MAG: hypothetical protein R3A44_17615 [Caldilineaceae bacterium]
MKMAISKRKMGRWRSKSSSCCCRGSREFADIDAYETFLFGVMEKRNRGRQARVWPKRWR